MSRTYSTVALFAAACTVSLSIACNVSTPLTPAPPGVSGGTAPDGSTLKVGAPTLVSPLNSDTVNTPTPTLTINPVTDTFAPTTQFQYEFDLQTDTGTVVFHTTTPGTSVTVPTSLVNNATFQWRARATLNGSQGPYSALGRFQTPKLATPTASSSSDEWKVWFFALIDLRGVGPTVTVQALQALDPDFKAAGVIQETNSAGQPRGRIYLPTGNPNNKFSRTVNLGNFGGPWKWDYVGGSTCEGGSCVQ